MGPETTQSSGQSTQTTDTGSSTNTSTSNSSSSTKFNPFEGGDQVRHNVVGTGEVKPANTTSQTSNANTNKPAVQTSTQTQGTQATDQTANTQTQQTQVSPQQQTAQKPAEQQQPQLTAETIAQAIKSVLPQGEQTRGQTAQPELSDQEFNKMFDVVNVDANAFTEIFGFAPERPEQLVAFNRTLQNLNKQTMKMGMYVMNARIKELETRLMSQFQPVLESTSRSADAEVEKQLFTEYPGLSDYRPLLEEIRDSIIARGTKFNSVQELNSFVVTKAAKLTGKTVEAFKISTQSAQNNGGQQQTQTQSTGNTQRVMTSATTGGRSGGTTTSSSKEKKTTAQSLFSEENS